ncbi:MAG: phage antirepressor protein [Candidatus Altiarchaeales archaeon A3]|nr:MAG: phage antirepressor protein [Candidatus Altiarchaeales archaeon A3]
MESDKALVVFHGKNMRRTWYNDEWYFSVVDVCEVLTDSVDAGAYWRKLKQRLSEEGSEVVTFCHGLKLEASDGKKYTTDCSNTEGIFRIIQSVPSPKAEPFKRWLAKVGYERIQEIENPELAQERAKKYYELKGYPEKWIEKRLRGIAIRQDLTDEWKVRGIEEKKDYAILTNEISKATFGMPIKDHKEIKGLNPKFKNQNLRDHMTDLELIFTMLGEASTTEIIRSDNSEWFEGCIESAKDGGKIAGNARQELENRTGKKVVSSDNYDKIAGKVEKIEGNSKPRYQKKKLIL